MLKRIKDEGVEHVLFWFTDLEGHLKSFAITPAEMEGALDDGMGFDGSSITGFNRIEESDMVAIPDPATFEIMPRPVDDHGHALGSKVGRMICDVVKPDGTPYEGDPRYILKLAVERMKKMGFDAFNVGPELEYFLFEDDKGTETIDEGGYFAMTVQDAATEVRNDTIAALESVGIADRVPPPRGRPVPARDRHALRRRARDGRQDDDVPDRRQGGRGLARLLRDVHAEAAVRRERLRHAHAHVAVQGRPQPVLRRARTRTTSPTTAKSFIAGLLVHARELSAVLAQWVNSYKRLVPGYEAPVYVAWSQRNRSALIRIPLYKPGSEQATRAEIRCPDPACNPYLAFAALLHAGLEGIEKGYKLPAEMTTNLYRLSDEERAKQGVEALPGSLGEAIEAFAGSELLQKALGEHIFPRYVELKRASGTSTAPR